jgi:hypothetical protein
MVAGPGRASRRQGVKASLCFWVYFLLLPGWVVVGSWVIAGVGRSGGAMEPL